MTIIFIAAMTIEKSKIWGKYMHSPKQPNNMFIHSPIPCIKEDYGITLHENGVVNEH